MRRTWVERVGMCGSVTKHRTDRRINSSQSEDIAVSMTTKSMISFTAILIICLLFIIIAAIFIIIHIKSVEHLAKSTRFAGQDSNIIDDISLQIDRERLKTDKNVYRLTPAEIDLSPKLHDTEDTNVSAINTDEDDARSTVSDQYIEDLYR